MWLYWCKYTRRPVSCLPCERDHTADGRRVGLPSHPLLLPQDSQPHAEPPSRGTDRLVSLVLVHLSTALAPRFCSD